MKPLITPVTAWLARPGVEGGINKTNTNNQVRVTGKRKKNNYEFVHETHPCSSSWREMPAVYGLISDIKKVDDLSKNAAEAVDQQQQTK